jgi:hypothetical protein
VRLAFGCPIQRHNPSRLMANPASRSWFNQLVVGSKRWSFFEIPSCGLDALSAFSLVTFSCVLSCISILVGDESLRTDEGTPHFQRRNRSAFMVRSTSQSVLHGSKVQRWILLKKGGEGRGEEGSTYLLHPSLGNE